MTNPGFSSTCTGCPLLSVGIAHALNTIGGVSPKAIECICHATGRTIWTFFLNSNTVPDYAHKIGLIRTVVTLVNGWLDHPLVDDLRDRVPPYPCHLENERLVKLIQFAAKRRQEYFQACEARQWQHSGYHQLFTTADELYNKLACLGADRAVYPLKE